MVKMGVNIIDFEAWFRPHVIIVHSQNDSALECCILELKL